MVTQTPSSPASSPKPLPSLNLNHQLDIAAGAVVQASEAAVLAEVAGSSAASMLPAPMPLPPEPPCENQEPAHGDTGDGEPVRRRRERGVALEEHPSAMLGCEDEAKKGGRVQGEEAGGGGVTILTLEFQSMMNLLTFIRSPDLICVELACKAFDSELMDTVKHRHTFLNSFALTHPSTLLLPRVGLCADRKGTLSRPPPRLLPSRPNS